ncbi:calcineurin-like phosphoesterase [Aspergillus floccosus]
MLQKLRTYFHRPSVPFQVLSDLHLEVNQQYASYEIPACAEYLILAGDIGRLADYNAYRDFIRKQTERFRVVFLVLGNHEFYNMSITAGLEKARQLELEPCFNGRLVLLHRKQYDIPGSHITVLGCTLWSDVPDESKDVVRMRISDFKHITGWTVEDHNANHREDLAWLQSEIRMVHRENNYADRQSPKRSVLVVTHHAPLLRGTSSPQHAQNPWRFAFGTDILPLASDGVKVWVFGHTHYTTNFRKGQTRVVSNQRGYVLPWSSSDGEDRFDVRKVIHIS